MKKYYETLEFSMIQKAIKNYCFSEMAKNQVDALKPYHDLDDLKLYQDDVFHAMTIIYAMEEFLLHLMKILKKSFKRHKRAAFVILKIF